MVLTQLACTQLLNYFHTHPNAMIHYHASDMILSLVSNATYLLLPNAWSWCATLFTLSNRFNSHPPIP